MQRLGQIETTSRREFVLHFTHIRSPQQRYLDDLTHSLELCETFFQTILLRLMSDIFWNQICSGILRFPQD